MEPEQVLEVIKLYRDVLGFAGGEAKEADYEEYPTEWEQTCHLINMCDRMEEMVTKMLAPRYDPDNDAEWEKLNRWLGFIQGVLWSQGVYKLSEMRDHNR